MKDEEIKKIYDLYLKNDNSEYLNRTKNINKSMNSANVPWENKDFPRIANLIDFQIYVKKYNLKSENALLFSPDYEIEYLPHNNVYLYNYDVNIDYDLHNLNIPEKEYDFAFLCQTLEHLYDPLRAVKNIFKYLKKGAYFYVNVPTINIQHMMPYNFYTGFTPVGLGCLLKQAQFNILEIGHWGNLDYINRIFKDQNWNKATYLHINTINDFKIPCQTWVLAQK